MENVKNKYAYFSNTRGEFEASVKSGLMFWTRGLHMISGKTKYQNKNSELVELEKVGDIVYVVVGSNLRNFEYEINCKKYKIEKTPSIVFSGEIINVVNHPAICYTFKPENSSDEAILPVELFQYLLNTEEFLGVKLTQKDKKEIGEIVEMSRIIQTLLDEKKINFEIKENENSKPKLTWILSNEDRNVIKRYLSSIRKEEVFQHYIEKLSTWPKRNEYVIVKLTLENPLFIDLDVDKLEQGFSTRQLIDQELEYYRFLKEADEDVRYSQVYINVLEKIVDLEKKNRSVNPQVNENKILTEISEILKYNKQVVLTGAPGTGKTYLAKEVCKVLLAEAIGKSVYELTENEIEKFIKTVQFHPSYDYTDFVEGLRPVKKGNDIVFERKDGIFMELCLEAIKDENKNDNFFLIIDEINRSDLSKVFGELMYCLEYRGKDGKIKTQYSNLLEDNHPFKDGFYVPENVYIIATMNDIDRSVEAFDFALRRRFFWYEIKANDVMESTLRSMLTNIEINNKDELISDLIKSAISLNNIISTEGKYYGLDDHYHLGPAYFGKIPLNIIDNSNGDTKEIKKTIWKYKIEQILREYVRGYDNIDDFIHKAKEAFENPT